MNTRIRITSSDEDDEVGRTNVYEDSFVDIVPLEVFAIL